VTFVLRNTSLFPFRRATSLASFSVICVVVSLMADPDRRFFEDFPCCSLFRLQFLGMDGSCGLLDERIEFCFLFLLFVSVCWIHISGGLLLAFWFGVFRFGLVQVGRWSCCSGGWGLFGWLLVVFATSLFFSGGCF
jgi:hypothetical protein